MSFKVNFRPWNMWEDDSLDVQALLQVATSTDTQLELPQAIYPKLGDEPASPSAFSTQEATANASDSITTPPQTTVTSYQDLPQKPISYMLKVRENNQSLLFRTHMPERASRSVCPGIFPPPKTPSPLVEQGPITDIQDPDEDLNRQSDSPATESTSASENEANLHTTSSPQTPESNP